MEFNSDRKRMSVLLKDPIDGKEAFCCIENLNDNSKRAHLG